MKIGNDKIIYFEELNAKEFHACSNICVLCRSKYFCTAFSNKWLKRQIENLFLKN